MTRWTASPVRCRASSPWMQSTCAWRHCTRWRGHCPRERSAACSTAVRCCSGKLRRTPGCCTPKPPGSPATTPWCAFRASARPAGPAGTGCRNTRSDPGRRRPGLPRPRRRRRAGPVMTGEEARTAFLGWLADERRASPLTVEAYGTDLADFLGFLTGHLGGEPDLPALTALRQSDIRAWLAALAGRGAVNATRARHLSAVRSFFRYLAKRHDADNPAVRLVLTPRAKKPLPRALAPADALRIADDIGEQADLAAVQARDTALFTLL